MQCPRNSLHICVWWSRTVCLIKWKTTKTSLNCIWKELAFYMVYKEIFKSRKIDWLISKNIVINMASPRRWHSAHFIHDLIKLEVECLLQIARPCTQISLGTVLHVLYTQLHHQPAETNHTGHTPIKAATRFQNDWQLSPINMTNW